MATSKKEQRERAKQILAEATVELDKQIEDETGMTPADVEALKQRAGDYHGS